MISISQRHINMGRKHQFVFHGFSSFTAAEERNRTPLISGLGRASCSEEYADQERHTWEKQVELQPMNFT